jgi:hypothetical protein
MFVTQYISFRKFQVVKIPNLCGMRALWLNDQAAQAPESAPYRVIRDLSEIPSLIMGWIP